MNNLASYLYTIQYSNGNPNKEERNVMVEILKALNSMPCILFLSIYYL